MKRIQILVIKQLITKKKNKNFIFTLNLKKGKEVINIDVYTNNALDIYKMLNKQMNLDEQCIKFLFSKINEAYIIYKNIFNSNVDFFTYKQILYFMELNETRNNNKTKTRKSKSVKGRYLINRYKDNDIMVYLCDIKNTANLNNSF